MTQPKEVRIRIIEQMVRHASSTKTIWYRIPRLGIHKSKVFQAKPGSLQELETSTKDAIRYVNENLITTVITNFCKRVDACTQEKGGQFGNVIYSK